MNDAVVHRGSDEDSESVTRPVLLKEAREAAGLHIAALAAALKVPVRKLEALEAGRYSELPDLTFARALASSACRQLKVDPAPILQQIPQVAASKLGSPGHALNAPFHPGHDEAPFNPLSWLSRPALLAAIALLLGALVIVFLPQAESPPASISATEVFPQPGLATEPVLAQEPGLEGPSDGTAPATVDNALPDTSSATAPTSTMTEPSNAQTSAASPDAAVNPATLPEAAVSPNSGGLLRISATGESWVEVTNGSGTVVTKRLLQSGEVIDYSVSPPYSVLLGRADAVQVSVRGSAFDTTSFARNNVARFEVK